MRITLTVEGAAEAQQLLAEAVARLEQPPRPLLEALAVRLQVYLQSHIREETGPEGPWPPLAPATRKIRAYYGHPPDGPALIRGGDLLQSITTLRLEDRAVDVGTRIPFARTLQDGGSLSDPKTGRTRTVQAFPFAYVSAQEVQDLVTLIQEHYFHATP
jgi:phage gpG-like protein